MDFEYSDRVKELQDRINAFMEAHIYPAEPIYAQQTDEGDRWSHPKIIDELKATAREQELWNLFLPDSERGFGLSNLEYAPLCEIMGRSPIA
ncbi:MAG: acyl-CoA dehydrogenase family protein, partial [Alphaproteobacteria bacterium]|nr:acyl-CoA dehydrogenase family protein [Alphaproteobacteria bacterium]